jgi:pyrroloquinoline-quinone synthase
MTGETFREEMLRVIEAKEHWAWPLFNNGFVAPERLHIHLEQEYATYVRDFAVLVGRAYIQCPVDAVRAELAENLFEEETGGLVAGRPHAELFLDYPRGLLMDLSRFESIELLSQSRAYRETLDELTLECGWEVAAAVTTIFLEGTKWDRGEIDKDSPKRPAPPLEEHPLVKHYGLPLDRLTLTKAHRAVEGSHRSAAWHIILDHVGADARMRVLNGMHEALEAWLVYRDGVAVACGLEREKIEQASA